MVRQDALCQFQELLQEMFKEKGGHLFQCGEIDLIFKKFHVL